jgi:hypothetical protein
MTVVKPLYGHTSFETAYMVDDYPYGGLRCKIWFWLEDGGPNKGYRFVSQTQNPKTGRMNAPKKGTYHKIAANMYIDENGHVVYDVVNEYTEAQKCYDFIKNFPHCPAMQRLTLWCKMKYSYERKCVETKRSPYGELSENRLEEATQAMRLWWRGFNLTQQKPEESPEPGNSSSPV